MDEDNSFLDDIDINLDELIDLTDDSSGNQLETKTNLFKESFAEEILANKKQDRKERKRYAKSTFKFLKIYTYIMLSILFLSGINGSLWFFDFSKFHLSDTVLITLISTSLASIVGIFAFVMKYLFKNN
jgi:hypothetical protein